MPFGFGIGLIGTDQIANGAITNVKVAAAAAIADSKLASPVGTHAALTATHGVGKISSVSAGSLAGAVTNQAVAHGLGVIPKGIFYQFWNGSDVTGIGAYNTAGNRHRMVYGNDAGTASGGTQNTVTTWDATNFYATVAAGSAISWVAVG